MAYIYSQNHKRGTGRTTQRRPVGPRHGRPADIEQHRAELHRQIAFAATHGLNTGLYARKLDALPMPERRLYVDTTICCYSDGEVVSRAQAEQLIDSGRAVRVQTRESGAAEYVLRPATLDEMRTHVEFLRRMRHVMSDQWTAYSHRLGTAMKALARLED